MDWNVISEQSDAQRITHVRVQQTLAGAPIHGQDMVLHIDKGSLRDLNGFAWTGKLPAKLPAPAPAMDAIGAAKNYLQERMSNSRTKPCLKEFNIPMIRHN